MSRRRAPRFAAESSSDEEVSSDEEASDVEAVSGAEAAGAASLAAGGEEAAGGGEAASDEEAEHQHSPAAAGQAEPAGEEEAAPERPWGQAAHTLLGGRPLTAADPRAPDPPGFRGHLYPPQATLLAAMIALERRPALALAPGAGAPLLGPLRPAGAATAEARWARLAAKFSFGKTILALALVCAQPVPARLPAQLAVPVAAGAAAHGLRAEATLRYARFLPLTVVAAAAGVISQWERETARFTALRSFTVGDVRDLREFAARYREGAALGLELLFVKAGRVTGAFRLAGEPAPAAPARGRTRSLLAALGRVLEGVPVARLVVDDYDTLRLAPDDVLPPALFTWFVSATRRRPAWARRPPGEATVAAYFRAQAAGAQAAARDDLLNELLSLRCDPAYVDAHLSATVVAYRQVRVRGGRAGAIMRLLAAPGIGEALDAGALGAAASALKLGASTVADLIRRVVGDRLAGVRRAAQLRAWVARARAALPAGPAPGWDRAALRRGLGAALRDSAEARFAAALARLAQPPGGSPAGSDADTPASDAEEAAGARLQRARAARLRQSPGGSPAGSDADTPAGSDADTPASDASSAADARPRRARAAAGDPFADLLEACEARAAKGEEHHGLSLARMRANIREGACQCCQVPFDRAAGGEAAWVMASCCQIVICELCVARREGAGLRLVTRCPNCAKNISHDGLVRVGPELDIEAALSDEALASPDLASEPAACQSAASAAAGLAGLSPKLRALVQLLRGEAVDCLEDKAAPPHIAGMLEGRRDEPWPAGAPRKWLIFAVYAEGLRNIEGALSEQGLAYAVLRGTRAARDEALRQVRDGGVRFLLVATPKDCSGLDLPWLSDIAFFHAVADMSVMSQLAARGQRLGRAANLTITTLLNESEELVPL